MTDPRPHQPFADLLLEQETRVSEAQLDEYRRKLQRRLAEAARHERRMRAATFGTAAVVLLGASSISWSHHFSARREWTRFNPSSIFSRSR